MPRYDFILFDADNTLFDFDLAEQRALQRVLTQYGYPVTTQTEDCYKRINRRLWAEFDRGNITGQALVVERFAAFTREMGRSDDPVALNRDYLSYLAEGSFLLPGAEELCRALAPHCTMAVITNGVAETQRARFLSSPLHALIPWLFISGEIGFQKPQRAFFELVLREMDIQDPSRTVVVGDNLLSDISGGQNAGLDTIWYNPGQLARSLDIRPTWEVSGYPALLSILMG